MLTSFLILLREGLEAVFVVTIVMSALAKLKRDDLRVFAWTGVALAIAFSVLAGLVLHALPDRLAHAQQAVFQAALLISASVLLTYVMIWFNARAKLSVEAKAAQIVSQGRGWRVLCLAFVAVLREGVEIVVFVSAALLTRERTELAIGAVGGLLSVALVSYLMYRGSLKIPFNLFFRITSVVLIIVAAGLLLQGVGHLQASNILPDWGPGLVNLDGLLSDRTGFGLVLHTLFGYDSNPTFLMLTTYLAYLLAATWLIFRRSVFCADSPLDQVASKGAESL